MSKSRWYRLPPDPYVTGRETTPAAFLQNSERGSAIQVTRVFDKSDTGTWVEGSGVVQRLLPDDEDDARHQRMVLDLRNGRTLLIAHNINVAARVPLGIGDRVRFRGLYEWNELGGILHWTHDDPLGVERGGYICFRARRYC